MFVRSVTKSFLLISALLAVCLVCSPPVRSGPVLDEILNYMYADQGTPMGERSAYFIVDRKIVLMRDRPIGQVFAVGLDVEKIVRIRVYLEPGLDWQPGEGVEMVVWDSPQKNIALGRYTIWYEFRGYDFCVAEFEVNAPVKPGNLYYFELSYVGNGDGVVCPVGVMNGQFNYEINQRVIYVNQAAPPGGDGRSWQTAFRTIQEAIDAAAATPPAQGYLAGKPADFDVCFQTNVKRRADPIDNLKNAFDRFDLTRPELAQIRKAVRKGDFETAIAKTVEHFETRRFPQPIVDASTIPKPNPDYDTTAAEMALQNYFWGDTGYGYVGPDINWRAEIEFDENGRIKASSFTLNRFGPRGVLANAYLNTGDERYAKKLNDLLIDWFKDNPPPEQSKIGGAPCDDVWSSLNTGIRLSHGFVAYNRIHASPNFTTDCRFAYILDLADHADTLLWNGVGAGGNWSMTQNSALLQFALDFPEFKNSKVWQDTACNRLQQTINADILPDGVETESAPGYQRWMYYNPLLGVYQLLMDRGVTTPFSSSLRTILERMAEFFMYLSMPDGTTPELGDWGDAAPSLLVRDAQVFNRADMLYVGTKGAQGTPPSETSKCYPNAGIVTMRSSWGNAGEPYEQARYLMCHGVHYGGHGHADLNGITLYAYGHEILCDPGSYIYGSPEHELLTQASSHNLMTIDNQNQNPIPDTPFRQWNSTSIADYLSSWIPAYAAGNYHREILYVKSNGDGTQDYWVIRDKAEGSGTHSLQQRWHFKPADVTATKSTATAMYAGGGNLRIMQITPSRLDVEQTTTKSWIPRGIASEPTLLPTVVYKINSTSLPAAIDTVLFPFKDATPPGHQLVVLETSPDGLESVFKLVQGYVEDLFVFRRAAGPKAISTEGVSFDGERLFVRRVDGVLRAVVVINGRQLTIDGREILNVPERQPWFAESW